jgi:hypothetical protein
VRVIVCGGRDFRSPAQVWRALDKFHAERTITELMQGGATGVDQFARDWAAHNGIKRYVCRADWERYGRAAGPKRNARMLEWKPDMVIAFPGGRGTANMVKQASEAGVPVYEALPPLPVETHSSSTDGGGGSSALAGCEGALRR